MRTHIYCLSLLVLVAHLGCGSNGGSGDPWNKSSKLKVLTTMVPYFCIASQIGGEDAEVRCLMIHTGPHDFSPTREHAKLLSKADLMVVNGLNLEEFLENMIREANNKGLRVVPAGNAIPVEKLMQAEGKPHYHGDKLVSHKGTDPHVWLGVDEMKVMAKKIAEEMIDRDAVHKAGYQKRLEQTLARLDELQQIAGSVTKEAKGNPAMVSFHDSFRYWARGCGVKVAGTIRDMQNSSISAAKLADQAKDFRKDGVRIVTREPQYPAEVAINLAKEIDPANTQMVELDPLETGPEKEPFKSDPEHYFTVMKQNYERMKAALSSAKKEQ